MSDLSYGLWQEANQRHLMAAVAEVRQRLERRAALLAGRDARSEPEADPDDGDADAPPGLTAPTALETLGGIFGLSSFERDLLALCAGMSLDPAFPSMCAAAQGDAARPYPTFSLALAVLPRPHWSALSPDRPLRRWHLVELGDGHAMAHRILRIDERVLLYLMGVPAFDERMRGCVAPVSGDDELPPSHRALARRALEIWERSEEDTGRPIVHLCGVEGAAGIAAEACAEAGLRLFSLRAGDVPASSDERETLARLWEREAALSDGVLLVEQDDFDGPERAGPLAAFLEIVEGPLIVAGRDPLRPGRRPVIRLDVPRPPVEERQDLWRGVLGARASAMNGRVEAVSAQFPLNGTRMRAAAAEALAGEEPGEPADALGRRLWDACRVQARLRLDDLARRIEAAAAWEDLVLPEAQKGVLREIAAEVRQRDTVYRTWGFAGRGTRGLGTTALFAGASGTGKTLAAEALADELKLDLYRIDLSAVVSKYIGETEKNLRRVFDAAEEGGAILLFDEADALFGKRSEVKDSHDRHANIEVSYLLQRMEAYHGLAILTSNLKEALDKAFLRRIRFVVAFPFPDTAQRAEIWRRTFPPGMPAEGIDIARLARLNVAGGSIRNIALKAAFLAADAGEPVRMGHLLRAAQSECAKIEKPLTAAEVEGWV